MNVQVETIDTWTNFSTALRDRVVIDGMLRERLHGASDLSFHWIQSQAATVVVSEPQGIWALVLSHHAPTTNNNKHTMR